MIVETGAFALILALGLAALQTAMAVAGRLRRSPVLAGAADGAAIAAALSVAVAFAALIHAFAESDFSVANVAANSHTDKPMLYKVAGAWGSHEGSLVLWCLVLTGFGAVLARARNLPFGLKTSAVAAQGLLGLLFLAFAVFTSNPFARLDPAPFQGASLNPCCRIRPSPSIRLCSTPATSASRFVSRWPWPPWSRAAPTPPSGRPGAAGSARGRWPAGPS